MCSCRCAFDHRGFWRHRPCAMWKTAIGFYWQMKCVWSVTRQSPEHCSSSASLLHIVRPFIHFGSQSSHSVVTLHYAHPHCSVHLEAILVPIQWRRDLSSTAQYLFVLSYALFVLSFSKYLKNPVSQFTLKPWVELFHFISHSKYCPSSDHSSALGFLKKKRSFLTGFVAVFFCVQSSVFSLLRQLCWAMQKKVVEDWQGHHK